MKCITKVLSMFLVLTMLISVMPINLFAESEDTGSSKLLDYMANETAKDIIIGSLEKIDVDPDSNIANEVKSLVGAFDNFDSYEEYYTRFLNWYKELPSENEMFKRNQAKEIIEDMHLFAKYVEDNDISDLAIKVEKWFSNDEEEDGDDGKKIVMTLLLQEFKKDSVVNDFTLDHLDSIDDDSSDIVPELIKDVADIVSELGFDFAIDNYERFLNDYKQSDEDKKEQIRQAINGISFEETTINKNNFSQIAEDINSWLTADVDNDDGIRLVFGFLKYLFEQIDEPILFDKDDESNKIKFKNLSEFEELVSSIDSTFDAIWFFNINGMNSTEDFLEEIKNKVNHYQDETQDEVLRFKQELERLNTGVYERTFEERRARRGPPPVQEELEDVEGDEVTQEEDEPAEFEALTPVETIEEDKVSLSLELEYTLTEDGKASYALAKEETDNILQQVREAELLEVETFVHISMKTTEGEAGSQLEIDREFLSKVAEETKANLVLDAGIAKLTFDSKALSTFGKSSDAQELIISVSQADTQNLDESLKARLEGRPVYQFTVKSGNDTVSNFNGGKAKIEIPYTLQEGENPNAVVVHYIDENSLVKTVRGKYNADLEIVEFITTHFSRYAVAYNEVKFDDVLENQWFKDAIDFTAAREIVKGVGNDLFLPDNNITRAQAVIMLMNAYGIEVDNFESNNFDDAGETYYTAHLATAKRLGIAKGVGNNMFAPNKAISREELFTLVYNALDAIDELEIFESGLELTEFEDENDIANWAKQPIEYFVRTGVVKGFNQRVSPNTTSTRAQMSQIIHNLLTM